MSDWSQAGHRLNHITISRAAAQEATGAPGGELEIEPGTHVGCGYQVVLPGGRVVHEAGLTLHGPAAQGGLLPDDLAAAVEAIWKHAEQAVSDREGLPPV